ncbi:hypothetical protein D8682_01310 [Buttiauxella sp. 3AFRM03]|uniref:hypothetical protein n=1 Tax=Buttiauxella sp. 3AFRM03 TaxID=2479367 RepID=UPI000EF79047|nr:hypothetical protein [Buttiauxella sp. 3AFRM03]AYN25740.1 hypothetical protein D8682_01310 [Buttiauxella sp. 3AFRM03]
MPHQESDKDKDVDDINSTRSMSVTREDFVEFFTKYEKKHGDLVCPLCQSSVWGLPSREDSPEHLAIVTLPIPFSPGRGMWAYPIICKECGYIVTFAANKVSAVIKGV